MSQQLSGRNNFQRWHRSGRQTHRHTAELHVHIRARGRQLLLEVRKERQCVSHECSANTRQSKGSVLPPAAASSRNPPRSSRLLLGLAPAETPAVPPPRNRYKHPPRRPVVHELPMLWQGEDGGCVHRLMMIVGVKRGRGGSLAYNNRRLREAARELDNITQLIPHSRVLL